MFEKVLADEQCNTAQATKNNYTQHNVKNGFIVFVRLGL